MVDARLAKVQESLDHLEKARDLEAAKRVVRNVSALLVPGLSEDVDSLFRLFNDQDGKLKANSGWFFSDSTIKDRLATYTLETPAESNLDIKVFGVKKAKKGTISWAVGLTPNFEDEPFNSKFNVGIDFIVPESFDRVIIALSKNYVIRTLELKGQLTATFQEILNSWLSITDLSRKVEFHEVLWNSLDLSPINKKFYEGISQRFISLRQHIETSGALDNAHAAQFANRLIGRVIFTWFLDKKSLIAPSMKYFESEDYKDDTDYYREKLEPLFFEVLNTPVADRVGLDAATPYLNGGLFEPKPGDLYKDKSLTFPKNFFDDFLGFLRAYNFTTDESTTEFQQVAIDPEMLGRIFENLLAEVSEETGDQARKAKGAFYTPRDIVEFMCREALKSYLRAKIAPDENLESRLRQLIEASEREFQDQDHNWRRDLKAYKAAFIEALDSLKVFDPACGSGAFPIGMMQLLLKVYSRLEPRFDPEKAKVAIIEKNLYGADIEPMAVEIARLRAWLSLVVDESDNSQSVKPLPNLDFKFVCANSLVPLEPLGQLSFFEDDSLDTKLQEIRDSYFKTNSLKQKIKLKNLYSELVGKELSLFGETSRTSQLKTFRPFESDSVAEFFDVNQMFGFDKFDVVIGNPPYVRQEKIRYKNKLQGYKIYQSTADLFTYFYELAFKNLSEDGVVSLITSSKFGKALYGERLREVLSSDSTIDLIVDFGSTHMFSAITNTWIVQARKSKYSDGHKIRIRRSIVGSDDYMPQRQLSRNPWNFTDAATERLISDVTSTGHTVKSAGYQIYNGLKTGCNEAFVIDISTRDYLLARDPRNVEIIKPLLRGRDIGQYEIKPISMWILATKNGLNIERDYPTIAEYLSQRNLELEGRAEKRGDKGSHWMNLRDCAYYSELESEKLVWLELSDKNKFAYSTEGEYLLNSAWMIRGQNLKTLLAILNSSLILYFFRFLSNSSGMGTTQWRKYAVEQLPLPDFSKLDPQIVLRIEHLVDNRIQTAFGEKVHDLEAQLNQLVYSLYGLQDDQIELVEAGLRST
jgi:type I restriction-modification system DNA methylase subunit